jgi:hypothetical protein
MTRRVLAALGIAATFAFVALASLPLSGQSGQAAIGAGAPDLVITAYGGGPPTPYAVPRTPWGDPDLQGVWSSDDAQFGGGGRGRGGAGAGAGAAQGPPPLYLTDEQYAARQKQIADGVARSEGDGVTGTFRSDFARRAFRQTRIVVHPPEATGVPQPLPEAQKRRAPRDQGTFGAGPFNSPEDFTLYDRCITRGIWGSIMRVIYGNGNRIVQAPGTVAISYEMVHDTRVFYTDGRPFIGDPIRQYLGDSRARWDGDVLVVETRNLTDRTSIGANGNGLRHSDQMVIVEKFKRVADDILQYQITISDPATYPYPFTASMPLTPLDGGMLLPYDCHEGNLAVLQSLGGDRAEDAALEADLAKGIIRPRRAVQDGGGGGGGGRGGRGGRGGSGTAEGEGGPQ